jgi:hypothetical protein
LDLARARVWIGAAGPFRSRLPRENWWINWPCISGSHASRRHAIASSRPLAHHFVGPWWGGVVRERIIGSIRRECLDYVIIFNETHLLRVLSCYFRHYHKSRTHLSLNKYCPDPAASNLRRSARSPHFRRSAASIIAANVARPKPPQSVGRDCVSEVRPFSTRCSRGAHILKRPVVGPKSRRSIVADERTPRSDRFLSKDRAVHGAGSSVKWRPLQRVPLTQGTGDA